MTKHTEIEKLVGLSISFPKETERKLRLFVRPGRFLIFSDAVMYFLEILFGVASQKPSFRTWPLFPWFFGTIGEPQTVYVTASLYQKLEKEAKRRYTTVEEVLVTGLVRMLDLYCNVPSPDKGMAKPEDAIRAILVREGRR